MRMEANGHNGMGTAEQPGTLLQPHSLEAEESVLGAMLVSEAAIPPVVVEVRLTADDFYRGRHATIYTAIHELYDRSQAVDALTVTEHLKGQGKLEEAGGPEGLASLAANTPVPGNAGNYAEIVKQNSMLRRLLAAGQQIQQSVHSREGEPQDLVERAEQLLFNVARAEQAGDFSSIEDILGTELERLDKLASGEAQLTGTPTGFKRLDEITGGFQPGNLIVLAARPAMGKSSLVCNIAENVALDANRPVAFFSLEMSETELAHRFIASQARIPSDRLRKGQVTKDWNKVLRACNALAAAPLWIDDSSDLSLLDLRAKCRRLHSTMGGLGLVIVDYIQLMRSDDPRAARVEQVGQMSRGLKILARELEVPVIGISQLSRAPEQRPEKIPQLSDLRESGCLTGDTRVFLPETGGWATMREIVELPVAERPAVLALDEAGMKLAPRPTTDAFSTGTKPVFRMRTRSGRTIRATGNHKFRTIDGWRRLDEIEPGNHVAVPRDLASSASSQTMSDDELALLGHLIGDGCISTWLSELGAFGLRSHEKRVPRKVFEQPRRAIAHFLRHLWATDGCVWLSTSSGQRRIYYATSSERLAGDVQSLLLRLGITATVRYVSNSGRGQWHVDVSGAEDALRFLEEVGAVAGRRAERAEMLFDSIGRAGTPNTNRDVLPKTVRHDLVKPAMAVAGVSTRALQASLGMSYAGSTLYRSNIGRDRAAKVAEIVQSDELQALASSDVYWDPVVSIEADGHEEVFDLTIDGPHNFVADDIVVHNSIEQDADIVSFIYRDEYYNKEDSDRQGEADLIIAKHRNGPIGTVELAFIDQYPKFANPASDRDRHDAGDVQ